MVTLAGPLTMMGAAGVDVSIHHCVLVLLPTFPAASTAREYSVKRTVGWIVMEVFVMDWRSSAPRDSAVIVVHCSEGSLGDVVADAVLVSVVPHAAAVLVIAVSAHCSRHGD